MRKPRLLEHPCVHRDPANFQSSLSRRLNTLRGMLSAKPWTAHSIIFLLAGIFFCISLTAVVMYFVVPEGQQNHADWKLFSFIVTTIGFQGGVLVCIGAFIREHKIGWAEAFGFKRDRMGRAIGVGMVAALIMTPMAWALGKLSAVVMRYFQVDPEVQKTVQTLRESSSGDDQIRFGVLAILLAPVVEEMLFRGIFYPSLKQAGFPRLAVLVTSVMFGLIHGNAMSLIPLTVFGVVLIALYEATDNLIAPITAHATFNCINFLFVIKPEWAKFLPSWLT